MAAFAIVALAFAYDAARVTVPALQVWKNEYDDHSPEIREEATVASLGFDPDTWDRLDEALGEGDRYHVLAEVGYQHEIRNYAGYRLLPAVQVPEPEDANLVVYWQLPPPAGEECADVGQDVCVLRRPS